MTGKSQLSGQGRLARRLAAARERAGANVAQALQDTARNVREAASETLRTGMEGEDNIARRIRISGAGTVRLVEVRHRAARFVEFGTRFKAALPFLGPAVMGARAGFRRRLLQMLRKSMRQTGE